MTAGGWPEGGSDHIFTANDLANAKDTDLPDLLSSLGYQVRRVGSYFTTKEMDSLRIKNRRTWFRYSEGKGGDAIDFLQRFEGKTFPEAVDFLLHFNGRARDSPDRSPPSPTPVRKKTPPAPVEAVPFVLPPANEDQRRVTAYLKKRGIAPAIIRGFVEAGLLYEEAERHNCVFVGKSADNEPVFAAKRGTYDLNGTSFRAGVPGSDKDTGFRLKTDSAIDRVHVFEAPIDLMSFCSLHRDVKRNAVALCGLYEGPLDTYLRDNPQIKYIFLCLDADGPGKEAAERMKDKYAQKGYVVSYKPPPRGKDWNEYLQHRQKCRGNER